MSCVYNVAHFVKSSGIDCNCLLKGYRSYCDNDDYIICGYIELYSDMFGTQNEISHDFQKVYRTKRSFSFIHVSIYCILVSELGSVADIS